MSFLKILNSALDNAAERPIFRTIYVAKNHKSLAGHLRLISTHALRCKCIYLPSRSPKMLSMTFISAIHWPESSGQSPQRCQCLEVLPMALPPIFFLHFSLNNSILSKKIFGNTSKHWQRCGLWPDDSGQYSARNEKIFWRQCHWQHCQDRWFGPLLAYAMLD